MAKKKTQPIYFIAQEKEDKSNDSSLEILETEDVIKILKIGKNHVYELLDSGAIKGFKLGRTWKIPKKSLEEFIDNMIG